MEGLNFCGAYLISCPYYQKDKKTGITECLSDDRQCIKWRKNFREILNDDLKEKETKLTKCSEDESIYCPGSVKRGESFLTDEENKEIEWMECVQEVSFCYKWMRNYESIKDKIPESKRINANTLLSIISSLKKLPKNL